MQIRYSVNLKVSEYIQQCAWEQAKLECCPFHPEGNCGLKKNGAYPRKFPKYCLIARWYCPKAHQTISLLPDCFASRLSGTLDEVEAVVNLAELCVSQEQAAEKLRQDITLPSAVRWLRRRLKYVREVLMTVTGLLGEGTCPNLKSFREKYSVKMVLSKLRGLVTEHLHSLHPIVGFGPRLKPRYSYVSARHN